MLTPSNVSAKNVQNTVHACQRHNKTKVGRFVGDAVQLSVAWSRTGKFGNGRISEGLDETSGKVQGNVRYLFFENIISWPSVLGPSQCDTAMTLHLQTVKCGLYCRKLHL